MLFEQRIWPAMYPDKVKCSRKTSRSFRTCLSKCVCPLICLGRTSEEDHSSEIGEYFIDTTVKMPKKCNSLETTGMSISQMWQFSGPHAQTASQCPGYMLFKPNHREPFLTPSVSMHESEIVNML